jgi:uncharacterized protein (DUF486 family)
MSTSICTCRCKVVHEFFLTLLYHWLLQNSKDYVKRIEDDDGDEDFVIPGQLRFMAEVIVVSLYSPFSFMFLFLPVSVMFLIINSYKKTVAHQLEFYFILPN